MILRNFKNIKKLKLIELNSNSLNLNKFSTNIKFNNLSLEEGSKNETNTNTKSELLNQLINLYEQNNSDKNSTITKPLTAIATTGTTNDKTLLYTNWEYLKACLLNNNFFKLNQELTKLKKNCRTDLRRVFIEFSVLLTTEEEGCIIDSSNFNSITILADHFVKYLLNRNPYFLNTIGLKVADMPKFYSIIYNFSEHDLNITKKLKLNQIFLNYFELKGDLKGLRMVYDNLFELGIIINKSKSKRGEAKVIENLKLLNTIWYQLMISLVGVNNQLSLRILNQLWFTYNYKSSTLPNPLDYIITHSLLNTSSNSNFKISQQFRISKLEILFPLYGIVEDYIKIYPNSLPRYDVEIQKLMVGMGHYYGLLNNIDGLINFLNIERIAKPNHYVYSTLIYNSMKLGFPNIGAKIFNQFMETRLNSKPSASNNAPYSVLLRGFSTNKQWDALQNYFDLRANLPLKLSPKLYDDIIFSFKSNPPPLRLLQNIYYQMIQIDKINPSIGCLDIMVKQLTNYQLDNNNNVNLPPLGIRLNNFYNNIVTSGNGNNELDTRFFNTMIYQLVTNTPTSDLESITQLLSNLYKDLIQRGLSPTTQFLTTMLIVYLKLGRTEGIEEILVYLRASPNLIDFKLFNLLKKIQ